MVEILTSSKRLFIVRYYKLEGDEFGMPFTFKDKDVFA